jgi:hypothetical protein
MSVKGNELRYFSVDLQVVVPHDRVYDVTFSCLMNVTHYVLTFNLSSRMTGKPEAV